MELKIVEIDGKQYAEVKDGKPVYKDGDNEVAFDAPGTRATISRLNAEAKSHREAKESAEKALKEFEGISDPQAAIKALETVGNLDSKKLIDAGEVEKVKAEINKAFQAQLDEAAGKAKNLEKQLYAEKIGGSFARSKLVAEKLAIPADLVQARFGSAFKIEEGQVVAYDQNGNKIFSSSNPGEVAGFDEALRILVDQYPYKDQILKGTGSSGSGSSGSPSGADRGAGAMSRQQFAALDPAAQMKAALGGVAIKD